jgi:hypothetical protein
MGSSEILRHDENLIPRLTGAVYPAFALLAGMQLDLLDCRRVRCRFCETETTLVRTRGCGTIECGRGTFRQYRSS